MFGVFGTVSIFSFGDGSDLGSCSKPSLRAGSWKQPTFKAECLVKAESVLSHRLEHDEELESDSESEPLVANQRLTAVPDNNALEVMHLYLL